MRIGLFRLSSPLLMLPKPIKPIHHTLFKRTAAPELKKKKDRPIFFICSD
jgi:hypothetical protein